MKDIKNIVIPNSTIIKYVIYIILIFPFISIYRLNNVNTFFSILGYAIFFIAFISLIIMTKKENRPISNIQYFILLFGSLLIFSTFINGRPINHTVISIIELITFCLITEYCLKNDSTAFIRIIKYVFLFYVIINFISIILFPTGMYTNYLKFTENWILGYKNAHITFIITLYLMSFLDSYKKKGKLDVFCYFVFILGFVSTILVKNSTGIIGHFILAFFIIFKNLLNKTKFFNSINYLVTYIVAFISIIILRLQNIFSFIIVDILKKDLSFTGRTGIWDAVIDTIKNKPVLGYGNVTFQYTETIITSHNAILDFWLKGGLLLVASFFAILGLASKKLYEYKDCDCAKVLALIIFVFCIMSLMEAYSLPLYFFIFVMAYNVKYIIKPNKEQKA